jgi:hypothetical protein
VDKDWEARFKRSEVKSPPCSASSIIPIVPIALGPWWLEIVITVAIAILTGLKFRGEKSK